MLRAARLGARGRDGRAVEAVLRRAVEALAVPALAARGRDQRRGAHRDQVADDEDGAAGAAPGRVVARAAAAGAVRGHLAVEFRTVPPPPARPTRTTRPPPQSGHAVDAARAPARAVPVPHGEAVAVAAALVAARRAELDAVDGVAERLAGDRGQAVAGPAVRVGRAGGLAGVRAAGRAVLLEHVRVVPRGAGAEVVGAPPAAAEVAAAAPRVVDVAPAAAAGRGDRPVAVVAQPGRGSRSRSR